MICVQQKDFPLECNGKMNTIAPPYTKELVISDVLSATDGYKDTCAEGRLREHKALQDVDLNSADRPIMLFEHSFVGQHLIMFPYVDVFTNVFVGRYIIPMKMGISQRTDILACPFV